MAKAVQPTDRSSQLKQAWRLKLGKTRFYLARGDALLPLSILGSLTGILAALVIILFRETIAAGQGLFLPDGHTENYAALPALERFALPALGALVIGLAFHWLAKERRSVGVVHVMERLAYHQGQMPLVNAVVQFIAGAFSIVCGHSVGREGPGIHLGAVCGSQLGQWLRMPHTYLRTLVACGVAAAIAASFNTPLAGVIFAMEVVLMEYTVAGFAPIILAAVAATTMMHGVYGADIAFTVPDLPAAIGNTELPLILLLGVFMGALAALFNKLLHLFTHYATPLPLWLRLTIAGMLTGLCAIVAPAVMGIGYDTVNGTMLGELTLGALLTVLAFKLLATTIGIGLGLPGGLIGPTLVIGAAGGGLLAALGSQLVPQHISSPVFYVVIGMGAMMAAALHAPLAALMAILELTDSPAIILPGMLAVIAATLTSHKLFHSESIFLGLLHRRGLDYRSDPVMQSLRNIGVASTMNTRFAECQAMLGKAQAQEILSNNPQWLIIQDPQQPLLMPGSDLARHLHQLSAEESADIDLLTIPATRQHLAPIDLRATLQEALEVLDRSHAEALYVTQTIAPLITRTYGILTRQDIEATYRYHPNTSPTQGV